MSVIHPDYTLLVAVFLSLLIFLNVKYACLTIIEIPAHFGFAKQKIYCRIDDRDSVNIQKFRQKT